MGGGAVIVKGSAFDVAPLSATVMLAVPSSVRFEAGTVACSCVPLTNAVANALPFHRTVEVLLKLLPVTVSVKVALPSTALAGLKLVSVGMPEVKETLATK